MKLRGLLVFLGFSTAVFSGEHPTDIRIFFLLGLLNMAERGASEPQDKTIHLRIFAFTPANVWAPGAGPCTRISR